jgi:hypothetical protein
MSANKEAVSVPDASTPATRTSSARITCTSFFGIDLQQLLIVLALCLLSTLIFWTDWWQGWGLVGGDMYSYFMPQKTYYATHLKQGDFPLWNNLVGHGYPVLGESQTAVLYPVNLLLYSLCDVQTAYNASQLGHYIFALLGTYLLARALGFSPTVTMYVALMFVYGWFPVRKCLEWAIITGAYFPWILWCAEMSLQHPAKHRWYILLSLLIGMVLLAGHYNLAFIALLCTALYIGLRFVFFPQGISTPIAAVPSIKGKFVTSTSLIIAVTVGFLLAAVQLIPTLELKSYSQRREQTGDYNPAYGYLPPHALSHLVTFASGAVTEEVDQDLKIPYALSMGANTNCIEAHFYLGIVPLCLVIFGLCYGLSVGGVQRRWVIIWMILAVVFVILAFGWLMPFLVYVPGFSYFTGPGRYTLAAQLALLMISAIGLEAIVRRLPAKAGMILVSVITLFSLYDLWIISESITYTVSLPNPPVNKVGLSHIKQTLDREPMPPRLFAPAQNLLTILGHAATPPYLGIGPQEYWNEATAIPKESEEFEKRWKDAKEPIPPYPPRLKWMQQAGVTHIISFQPFDLKAWPCDLISDAPDAFINSALGRQNEPVYFYRLNNSRGRFSWANSKETSTIKLIKETANRIEVDTSLPEKDTLILTELDYPGWRLFVDGQQVPGQQIDGMFRGITLEAGNHKLVWSYRPLSIVWGGYLSTITLILGMTYCYFRHRQAKLPDPA